MATYLPLYESLTVIPGFFHITHVENPGAAFGLFAESAAPWKVAALVGFSLVALIIVTVLLWKNSHVMNTTTIGLSLILGGATGNFWDRIVAIVIGAILLVSEILFAKPSSEVVKSSS